ncbi:hypothetical protein QQF64_036077 [Cirrhinus molitorella]|uniref:Uncharacterized protein n=1 Tax=Cirrhinus molitorella TaxID=172907 RepID=A0ABR3NHR9_9TELE
MGSTVDSGIPTGLECVEAESFDSVETQKNANKTSRNISKVSAIIRTGSATVRASPSLVQILASRADGRFQHDNGVRIAVLRNRRDGLRGRDAVGSKFAMEMDTEEREFESLLQTETEGKKEKDIKGAVKRKDKNTSELLRHEQDSADLPRRSERPHILTEKMLANQKEECCKKEKRLTTLYEQWKLDACKARQDLKTDISDKQLAEIADSLEDKKNCIMKIFSEIREYVTPAADLRCQIDACEAVTSDIVKIVFERIAAVDGEFDAERERGRLRRLLAHSYARSICGSSASQMSVISQTGSSCTTSKQADAAAELAAKEAEYKMMQMERQQKEKCSRTL